MKKLLLISFNDESPLKKAVSKLIKNGVSIYDIVTPFPIHEIDVKLEIKESRIPVVAFICGLTGAIIALGFQSWAFVIDYPLNIGGKPNLSIPSFIPISFELTILFAAIGMMIVFFLSSKIGPGAKTKTYHNLNTDSVFTIILNLENQIFTEEELHKLAENIENAEINLKYE